MHRRKLLALGAVSAVALAVGGGTLAILQPGLRDGRLTAGGREVFAGVARALLDGSLPSDPMTAQPAMEALLARIDGVVGGLPPHAQSELSQLLALLSTTAGRRSLAGLADPWPRASVAHVQTALQAMRISALSLRQQAYQALHDIVGGAYFSDARTWSLMGYPGPREV